MANQFIGAFTALWNSGATKYFGIKLNVTDSASDADSRLIELQDNAVLKFSVRKDGATFMDRDYTGDGTAALPAKSFTSQLTMGLYRIGASILGLATNGVELMRFTTTYMRFVAGSGGVQFNGATAAANALNDYEEGTWFGVLSDGTNNATMSITGAFYIKVGRLVTIYGRLATTSLGACAGNARITGLPYAPNQYAANASGYCVGMAITAGTTVTLVTVPGLTYLTLFNFDIAAGTSPLQASEWSATGEMRFSLTYSTA